MKVFRGQVTSGYGAATQNVARVMHLIESRTGLANLVPGTLNLNILEECIVLGRRFHLSRRIPAKQNNE